MTNHRPGSVFCKCKAQIQDSQQSECHRKLPAACDTLLYFRGDLGIDVSRNLVHGSDGSEGSCLCMHAPALMHRPVCVGEVQTNAG